MIRRGFWLVAGAVVGVTGYRKATRLARTLAGQPGVPQLTRAPGRMPAATFAGRGDRGAVPPWPARLAAGIRSAASFLREVRAGMADYRALHGGHDDRALHREKLGRSLGSRSLESPGDRQRPGVSQRGPLEP